ncbi:D-isomer specific 2-hydroxyacid dehydrogenase family protein [Pseudomonas sp. LJDD11]|uniref:D-isomer specific 2-hydroxyacid dehydrogenase family protein n=1 Tax=unclassified Pseudomonas TaxID=196821 RepID=UPI0004F8938E|nr:MULTISPECIES: D-isomer specific 2-hydroxyacid dehydrogenase family protein [unclassified Pseudomonas]MCO8163730.1 D-isomer specific 2-hydroxyacid dehydrogenase family protein [Pseudomonas sp. 21LCFQ010]MCQ9425749.1 D-isomer specific 2-hydroxyacid dehydrogenase family protein [Pseudomonas sp. LJDD11]BAP45424.1 D-isomer specific 2-hydroxyacid dehydrogenase NAD-binding protein [Pseudomonas sp. StFLB209]
MSHTVIASQHDEEINALLRQRLPEYTIVAIGQGAPQVPPEASILLTRPFFGNFLTQELPEQPAGWPFNLKWVQLTSSGIDGYPAWLFDQLPVSSARGTASVAVAEFALAAILAQVKQFPQVWIDSAEQWQRFPLQQLSGSTLGIVGFGAIGRDLAVRAQALGVRVIAVNRSGKPFDVPGVERAESLEKLFAESDHVVLAAPATSSTRQLVDKALLSHAKPGLHLVNIARGSLIDEAALLDALDAGQLSRATLDVTAVEPTPADHPFYKHPKVRLSPHVSPASGVIWHNIVEHFVANLLRYHKDQPLGDVVDFERGY